MTEVENVGLRLTNDQFSKEVDDLYARCKGGELADRQTRMAEIETLTERYFAANEGKMPPAPLLDRLATLCLREEMTDAHPDKMTREEWPVMSDTQREEREQTETSGTWAEEIGVDGANYRKDTRENKRKMRVVSTR
ncbi:hypothetical protein [Salibacterium aidingense]|uniref:hypothetical protein n=1 Tax=Salibacterium aidingense TaxID=384933 RepID=UPI003BD521EF